jgi:hypothetical protein
MTCSEGFVCFRELLHLFAAQISTQYFLPQAGYFFHISQKLRSADSSKVGGRFFVFARRLLTGHPLESALARTVSETKKRKQLSQSFFARLQSLLG